MSFYLRLVLWDMMLYSLVLYSVKGILLLFPLASCTLHFRDLIFPLASLAIPHFQGLLFALVFYHPNFRASCSPWMSCLHLQGLCWLACLACYVQGVFCPVACLASHLFAGLQGSLSIGLPCHPFWGLEAHIGLSGLPFPLFIHGSDWRPLPMSHLLYAWRWRQCVPLKHWLLSVRLHDITSEMSAFLTQDLRSYMKTNQKDTRRN